MPPALTFALGLAVLLRRLLQAFEHGPPVVLRHLVRLFLRGIVFLASNPLDYLLLGPAAAKRPHLGAN